MSSGSARVSKNDRLSWENEHGKTFRRFAGRCRNSVRLCPSACATGISDAGRVSRQRGRFLYLPAGSHMSMYDDQQRYVAGLIAFLRDVDAGRFTR